jgi:hypothetical protein
MERELFLREIYRYYFEQGGRDYLFVVVENHGGLVGRLYNNSGMMPGFQINIDDEARVALSSYHPTNPFEAYIKVAGDYINELSSS